MSWSWPGERGVEGTPGSSPGKGLRGGRGLVPLKNLGVKSVAWNKVQEVKAMDAGP